jgi:hypothetical protein
MSDELERLLSAEPSPEFVARVRAHLASEAEPSRFRASKLFLATAVVVVAGAFGFFHQGAPDRTPANAAELRRLRPPIDESNRTVDGVRHAAATPVTKAVRVARAARRMPDVQVSTDEASGVRAFLNALGSQRVDFTTLTDNRTSDPPQSVEIAVAPINVEPLQ